ncbi:hypothetical protein [Candidatus Tisiphia endosymbiont of Neophilaenus lineatus]|uniref:hypothetical protein n=1 Tax=Candidatus Tisiphia endosymbiont of Neophilaenus lineatus TaxID=3139336 RepID=UPI0035CC2F32
MQWNKFGNGLKIISCLTKCYGVYEDIVTMACYAWNQLAHNVDLVKSIMYRD